jgi:Holliday junction resolvase RusA-like endonuclease
MARTPKPRPRAPFDEIHIVVRGKIGSWKRPRQRQHANGKVTRFTDPDQRSYFTRVSEEAERAMGDNLPLHPDIALEMSVLAVYQIPKSWPKAQRLAAEVEPVIKVTKPDLDNGAIKGVKDAFRQIVYHDDAQVGCYGKCLKVYGLRPRLEVVLTVVDRVDPILPSRPVYEQPDLFEQWGKHALDLCTVSRGPAGDC